MDRVGIPFQNIGGIYNRGLMWRLGLFAKKCKRMLWHVQIKHIRIMCGKNQLLIFTQMLQHQAKNPLFNIALYIGKVLITVVKAILSCK